MPKKRIFLLVKTAQNKDKTHNYNKYYENFSMYTLK